MKKKEYKKRPGHSVLFDIVLAVLLLSGVVTGIYFAVRPADREVVYIEYIIELDEVESSLAAVVQNGQKVYNDAGDEIGEISTVINDVKERLTVDMREGAEYRYGRQNDEDYRVLTVTVRSAANYDGLSFVVYDQVIKAGRELNVRTVDFYGKALVTNVRVIEVSASK